MTTIVNAIPEYIITAVISAAFCFTIKQGQALVHSKVQHAKTERSKMVWTMLVQMADTAVASLVSASLTGSQKFAKATELVQQALASQGFTTVNVKAIEAAVQAAYEKSPLTPMVEPAQGTAVAIDTMKGDK